MNLSKIKIEYVPIDSIKPRKANANFMPQDKFDALVDDIKRNKTMYQIKVTRDNVIIDGHHRWRACKSLGHDMIPVEVLDVDESQADILALRINRERGYLVPVETGAILQNLKETIPVDILADVTQIPQDEINILTSIKFDPKHKEGDQTDERIQWGNVEQMVSNLADEIKKRDGKFITIYTVSKGGLVPARLLADRLGIDDIQILIEGGELATSGLFVDDIYDTGKTYRKFGKKAACYATLHIRKGAEKPKNVIAALETEGSEYIVYPWDKLEFKRSKSTTKRTK